MLSCLFYFFLFFFIKFFLYIIHLGFSTVHHLALVLLSQLTSGYLLVHVMLCVQYSRSSFSILELCTLRFISALKRLQFYGVLAILYVRVCTVVSIESLFFFGSDQSLLRR